MTRRGLFGLPISFRFVVLIATVFGVLNTARFYVGHLLRRNDMPFEWFFYVSTVVSHYFTWILLTPILYRLSKVGASQGLFTRSRVFTHMGIGMLVAVGQTIASLALRNLCFLVRDGQWFSLFDGHGLQSMAGGVFEAFIEYWILVSGFVAIDYYRMYRQKEVELVRMENELNNAKLSALRMQLRPHFLFNTLHTISSLMNENIDAAQKMVTQLGYLLRTILEGTQEQVIPLREEVEYIRSYLDIEETRFQDRLRVDYSIGDDTRDALVPSLILQPLVENAIKHGFARQTAAGVIRVTSNKEGGNLVLTVEDNGCGIADTEAVLADPGVGLANIIERLKQTYSSRARLEVVSALGEGMTARIVMPFQPGGAPA